MMCKNSSLQKVPPCLEGEAGTRPGAPSQHRLCAPCCTRALHLWPGYVYVSPAFPDLGRQNQWGGLGTDEVEAELIGEPGDTPSSLQPGVCVS